MTNLIRLSCIIAYILHISAALLDSNVFRFLNEYLLYKNIQMVTGAMCSKYDTYRLSKSLLSTTKYWVLFSDPEQPALKLIENNVKRSYYKYGIFVDYDCISSQKYLLQNSVRHSLNASYHWVIWSNSSMSLKKAEDLNLHMDTDMTWVHPDVNHRILLYDLYKINYSWPLNATLAGHWDPKEGLHYNLTQYKYERRQDMRGIILRAGLAVNNIPTENIREELLKPGNRRADAMGTYNFGIFLMLEQLYNFTGEVIHNKFFGYVVENGKLEGLVLMLDQHEVDLSISAIQTNRARYRHTDFVSVPTWEFRLCTIFRHPPVLGAYGAVLFKPFEKSVWISCAAMWLVVILVIRLISWVETTLFERPIPTHVEEETVESWSDVLMIIVGAISEQGTTLDSRWLSWRTAFFAAFILSMMVNINYSASLVSSLLTQPPKTIKSTRDLIDSQLEFGAENITYSVPYFAMNKDPLVHELYEKKMARRKKAYYNRDEALNKIINEPFAYHTEAINVYDTIEETFSDKAKCELSEVLIFVPEKCYLPIPWGSPYKELVAYGLRKASERGLIDHQNRVWRAQKPPCSIKEEFVSVDMDTISPAFIIVILGAVSSIIIFVFERLSYRRKTLNPKEKINTLLQLSNSSKSVDKSWGKHQQTKVVNPARQQWLH